MSRACAYTVVPPAELDTGSNSPRDSPSGVPSGSFANQLTRRAICPELCRSLHSFPNSASLSERLHQSFVTERINIGSREARKRERGTISIDLNELRVQKEM
jgi:hypothetical protein